MGLGCLETISLRIEGLCMGVTEGGVADFRNTHIPNSSVGVFAGHGLA